MSARINVRGCHLAVLVVTWPEFLVVLATIPVLFWALRFDNIGHNWNSRVWGSPTLFVNDIVKYFNETIVQTKIVTMSDQGCDFVRHWQILVSHCPMIYSYLQPCSGVYMEALLNLLQNVGIWKGKDYRIWRVKRVRRDHATYLSLFQGFFKISYRITEQSIHFNILRGETLNYKMVATDDF